LAEDVKVYLFKVPLRVDSGALPETRHRQVSAAAREFVRTVISQRTGCGKESLVFAEGEHGKPYIENCDICFNLSHCGNFVLAAFSRAEVGVDIELACRSGEAVVERIFTRGERDYVALARTQWESCRRFGEIWTAKEAFVKLNGTGLMSDMDFSTADGSGMFDKVVSQQWGSAEMFRTRVEVKLEESDDVPMRGQLYGSTAVEFQICVCAKALGKVYFENMCPLA
jgi:phosphopantetheinyl transferase (holo-ACP synthase)